MRSAILYTFAFVLAGVTSSSRAALPTDEDHALPCRPTIACTADFVPPGQLELELGYLYRRLGSRANQHSVPFLLKLTVAEWLQLQIGSNGATLASAPASARFFDNVAFTAKLHLQAQTKLAPALSFSAALSVPTAAATGYTRATDLNFIAYITKDIARVHADLNLGVNVLRIDGASLTQAWTALALSVELPRRFGAMVEGYYFSDAAPFAPTDAGILAAVSYTARSWFIIDVGGDGGLIARSRAASAFVGLTIIPVKLWRPRRAR